MSSFLSDRDRRVVPRWRDFRTTASTGELDGPAGKPPLAIDGGDFFEQKLHAWKVELTVGAAADLLAAALVLGRHDEAADAAHAVLAEDSEAMPAVKAVASLVLSPAGEAGIPPEPDLSEEELETEVARLRVRALRAQLGESHRNGLLWVDLARAYAVLGQIDRSVRAMERALMLGPSNRFVLRCAARLFVHIDDAQRALDLLRRAEQTRVDPWLLAAEIAVASVADKNPTFVRQARNVLVGHSFRPLHVAELASAVATLEMKSGALKKARRLFRQSLEDPTDNAVAQAGWASRMVGGLDVTPALLRKPRSFEARAVQNYHEGRWAVAIDDCRGWLLDERFSSRPALLGSYLSEVTGQDHQLSERFARRGLVANPGDALLLNNLVVALASRGCIEEAWREFAKMTRRTEELEATLLATEGLLNFRSGNPEAGRDLYAKAIENASSKGARRVVALAALHLAREEVIARTPEAGRAVRMAEDACKGVEQQEILQMLEILRQEKL